MIEQKKKTIDGIRYAVTQLDGIRALKIQTKLIKVLGSSLANSLSSGLDFSKLDEFLKKQLPNLLSNFDDEVVNKIILDLFDTGVFVERKGSLEPVDFEIEFAGKINHMWKVAAFIIEVNFGLGKPIESDSSI